MGFVWKVRDKETGPGRLPMISITKQQQILGIVQVQYNLQGHTKYTALPNIFTVPSTPQWPHHLHECIVEVSLLRRAHRMGLLDASIVASMDAMGFVWDVSQHQWGLFMEALCTFKTLYGHVEVPSNFQVPDNNPEWPVHLWAMKLGSKVHSVRSGKLKVTLERKQELDAMEFLWDAEELHRERILLALKTYKEIHNDLYVPKLFVVPTGDPAWPSDVAGMKLGYVGSNLRERRDSTSDKFKKQLDSLGFTWSGKRVES
ncbi:hypothetical protein Ae201684P_020043 [Aphanomyces euteiches]|uniref:Helicase-associated domain-containing protein n=1 Tax=Aphanomyces euteiches TaxID=100861 RepID=A0A6G0W5X0_9STRA|nr:hypothetical protein Ae201684_018647 [Aphanomyces euteiches]KAH9071784.1 hypothetical protein Ae201684P_020043 [Aphanomyces euteiches]